MIFNRSLRRLFLALCGSVLLSACAGADAVAEGGRKPVDLGTPEDTIVLGMGCFWGAEKRMAETPGVIDVESGYANGEIEGSYRAVVRHERALRWGMARGRNHAEVVKVRLDPTRTDLETVLIRFWESHDPTQGDRQGNDVGSNYRSAIYTQSEAQAAIARATRDTYQKALDEKGLGGITTEIATLESYIPAEDDHQDYLARNPLGYCGLAGTGVKYPGGSSALSTDKPPGEQPLDGRALAFDRQLVVFEAADCAYCQKLKADLLDHWQAAIPVARTFATKAPSGWTLEKALFATPTVVLFEQGKEVARFTGYNGEKQRFWAWLGFRLLTPEQRRIAFTQGTEPAFTGSHLDEKRPGTFVDPVTGAGLFRSDSKFDSGSGWPSFFDPLPGAITLHEDQSQGMKRIEVRSASSGIHLGHVFEDGPPPSHKRYCINGNVLKFIPDARR